MVYHLFERIFNPENFKINGTTARVNTLVAEGFSTEEAEEIAWLQNHQTRGKFIGIGAGLFAVYACSNYFSYFTRYFPSLKYWTGAKFLAQAATVYAFYKLGDYYFTSRRYGSNDPRMNGLMYSNRYYSENKESLIQNFEPLNRRFTQEEVEQFLNNQDKDLQAQRNWIYNPHLHGDSEASFRAQIAHRFTQAPWERDDVKSKILQDNKAKVAAGEEINFKPFKPLNHLDKTGILHRLHPFRFSTNFTMVD